MHRLHLLAPDERDGADHLVVLGRGRVIADTSVAELIESARRGVHVRTPRADDLVRLLSGRRCADHLDRDRHPRRRRAVHEDIAARALEAEILLYELTPQRASLEKAYTELTEDAVEYRGTITSSGEAA